MTYTNHECTAETFRPVQQHAVRWLEVEQDYELAQAFWNMPLALEDWRQFRADGYRYAAVIEEERIVSLAAAWSYSERAWEVAGVYTSSTDRRKGYGRSVVSFITAYILAAERKATCLTESENLPMQRTAESVGFYQAPR